MPWVDKREVREVRDVQKVEFDRDPSVPGGRMTLAEAMFRSNLGGTCALGVIIGFTISSIGAIMRVGLDEDDS